MPLELSGVPATELWAKLVALDLDGNVPFSFSKRLARDNGWSLAFAQRVVGEYKKFIYLAATCGHPVTPSDEVDQAWHLHLVYTRSYWEELCGQILGFPLHHGPTKGGAVEGQKFESWYARTMQAYELAFDALPPADIWPPATVRFGEALHFRRVNLRRHYLVPRLRWRPSINPHSWLVGVGTLALVGCSTRLPLNPLNWHGTEFLLLYWSLCLTLIPLAWWLRYKGRGPEDATPELPLSTYELARLAQSGQVVADSALAALAYTGKVALFDKNKIKRATIDPPTEPYERAVWDLINPSGGSTIEQVRRKALYSNVGALQALDESLEAKGLLLSPVTRQRLDKLPWWVTIGLGAFGVVKILVGILRDRPVGWLLASVIVLIFIAQYSRTHLMAWATGRGARLLRETKAHMQKDRQHKSQSPMLVALTVALFGIAELRAIGMEQLADYLAPIYESGDGGSDGSSDGGSGCGSSGCGGCGGCGGD